MIPTILAWLVILIAVPLTWFVAWRLARLSMGEPGLRVLRERALSSVHSALVVSVFAGVFLNNGMAEPLLDSFLTMVITRVAILSLIIPPIRWLFLYQNGRR